MKATSILFLCGIAAVCLLNGCTSVESTQKFNQLGMTDRADKAVCHTHVEIPCYYFWGIPLIGGSAEGPGKMAIFQNNADVESVMFLLTREIRSKNGVRVINAQTVAVEHPVALGLFSKRIMQASGTGVRTRTEAMDQAGYQFDMEPIAY